MLESSVNIARLLIVSRDAAVLAAVESAAGPNGWQTEDTANIWEAMQKVHSPLALDLLILDLSNDPAGCAHALKILARSRPQLPLVLIGPSGDLNRSQEVARLGASSCLARPLQESELEVAIQRSLSKAVESFEMEIGSDDVEPVGGGDYFIGISHPMRQLKTRIVKLAETDAPVLLVGEPGSGRETVARLLHKLSIRSGFEFVRVNCAALPEELLEREIFGPAAGSGVSPGAKRGKSEFCDRGTIFLDEITEMPLRLQERLAKLIRDQRSARGTMTNRPERDVRLVAACTVSADHQTAAERRLLTDLARGFSDSQVCVPALRERREELPILARHFMRKLARRYSVPPRDIAYSVCAAWQAHHWPGNLTELEESVKRYMVAGEEETRLSLERSSAKRREETRAMPSNGSGGENHLSPSSSPVYNGNRDRKSLRALLRGVKEEAERNAIARALEETGWNRKAAARLLKTSYRTVLYKIEQYHMTASDPSLPSSGPSLGARSVESNNAGREKVQMGSSNLGA